MPRRLCGHCKQWVDDATHDCWTTTEAALTRDLSEDLLDAWERLRQTAAAFGDQRIYASHNSIMFSREACYCFVRPKKTALELCFFLGRILKAPQVTRTIAVSRLKNAHFVRLTHRDQVEAPLTDWIQEAYDVSATLSPKRASKASAPRRPRSAKRAKSAIRKKR